MHGTRSQWYGYFDPKHWNAEVNDELISAQGLIDGIRNGKQRGSGTSSRQPSSNKTLPPGPVSKQSRTWWPCAAEPGRDVPTVRV